MFYGLGAAGAETVGFLAAQKLDDIQSIIDLRNRINLYYGDGPSPGQAETSSR